MDDSEMERSIKEPQATWCDLPGYFAKEPTALSPPASSFSRLLAAFPRELIKVTTTKQHIAIRPSPFLAFPHTTHTPASLHHHHHHHHTYHQLTTTTYNYNCNHYNRDVLYCITTALLISLFLSFSPTATLFACFVPLPRYILYFTAVYIWLKRVCTTESAYSRPITPVRPSYLDI
ncbi:hypothetical protein TWF506_003587 [Arthrobotrys conoides]|uniref:Uncharacterized protein n=1 Tax=Arthrobotrys conoides TaxID=74498 RepID=A0AAN8RJY7_9PEZI